MKSIKLSKNERPHLSSKQGLEYDEIMEEAKSIASLGGKYVK